MSSLFLTFSLSPPFSRSLFILGGGGGGGSGGGGPEPPDQNFDRFLDGLCLHEKLMFRPNSRPNFEALHTKCAFIQHKCTL